MNSMAMTMTTTTTTTSSTLTHTSTISLQSCPNFFSLRTRSMSRSIVLDRILYCQYMLSLNEGSRLRVVNVVHNM